MINPRRNTCLHRPVLSGAEGPVLSGAEGAESRWSKTQIRAARRIELAPLLQKRGLALRDRGGGNFEPDNYKGILIKASYWIWPERKLAGNAIDFYTKVLRASFHDAMKELLEG